MAGLGPTGTAKVVAAVELGRRTLTRAPKPRVRLKEPWDAAADLVSKYGRLAVQHFGIVMLDVKRRILNTVVLSRGTEEGALIDPREVFGAALGHRAAAIILFHNHPSGDPTPDVRDVALTARLVEAEVLMGIKVLDHLVLSDGGYYSFKREGRLGGEHNEA